MWVSSILLAAFAFMYILTKMFIVTNEHFGVEGIVILGITLLALFVVVDIKLDERHKKRQIERKKQFEQELKDLQDELNQNLKEIKKNADSV